MKFRPCIDLHEGVVKQIVGSSLADDSIPKPSDSNISNSKEDTLIENFVSTMSAEMFAK